MKHKKALLFLLILMNVFAFFRSVEEAMIIVTLTAVILLATNFFHPIMVSILVIALIYIHSPASDASIAFSGFTSPVLYFLVGVTGVGVVISNSTVGHWLLHQLQKMIAHYPLPLSMILLISFVPLSLFLPSSITRIAMLGPLIHNFVANNEVRERKERIFLTLGVLNTLASSAMVTGGLSAMITAEVLGGFSWLKWFFYMAFPYYAYMLFGWLYLYFRYPAKQKHTKEEQKDFAAIGKAKVKITPQKFSFTKEDVVIIFSLILMASLWVTDRYHSFHPAFPALLGLLLIGFFTKKIDWEGLKSSTAIDNLFIMACLFSLIEALRHFGVLDQITANMIAFFSAKSHEAMLYLIIILSTIIFCLIIPNITAVVTLLMPIYVSLAPELGLSPMIVCFIAIIVIDSIKFFPVQSTPLLMIYQLNYFHAKDVLQMGVAMTLIFIAALFLIFLPFWSWLGY